MKDDAKPYPTVVARDAYDEAAFERARASSPHLNTRIDSGAHLHPGFEALAQDVFALLFKYTTSIKEAEPATQGRTALARRVVGWVLSARDFERLRAETVLDEGRATYGTRLVLEHVLRNLRREEVFSHEELLEGFEIKALEERAEDLEEQKEDAEALAAAQPEGEPNRALEEAIEGLDGELSEAQQALARLLRSQLDRLDDLPVSIGARLRELTQALPERMEQSELELQDFGRQMGTSIDRGMPAAAKLELGDRLMTNDKLRRLARLVGAFRHFARAARRARFERRPTEVHAIERGRDLARLLPAEAGHLRHPQLRRVFLRRYLEGDLLQYAIEGQDKGARGPLVVCIDGSGSMSGDKEMWAKAVCLTLLEIARRQKRHFRAIVFSGGQRDLRVFDLLKMPPPGRLEAPPIQVQDLVAFADYFPRGGTDFQSPLDKALEILQHKKLRRGDIVFITDGESHVAPEWLAGFLAEKKRLDFQIYGVMVDVGGQGLRTDVVERFADQITSISQLSAEDARDIFIKI